MFANLVHGGRAFAAGSFAVLLFVVFAPSLAAQWPGELIGTVTGPGGAPVPFALVTTTSIDTGRVLPAATGTDGRYDLSLPPGNYQMRIDCRGYKTAEIASATINESHRVVLDRELEADAQTTSNSGTPGQKPATPPSNNPKEPSLEDLGITPAQAKGSAQAQALLDRRSHMLKTHQRLGLITIGPLGATLITSAFAGGRQTSSTSRDLHAALGTATVGLYFTTAYFAIRAPKVPGTQTRGPIRLHKALAWIHGPGMVLTPILGEMAFAQKSRGEKVHGIASLHGPVAITTAGAFGLAVASVSIKF